jgi:hypothetical protein
MMTEKKSNLLKGQNSFDIEIGGTVVPFFNKNVTPYPTEVGAPKFDLVPVKKQKDIMLNVARMHAQQEYQRIMDLVSVLQTQAQEIKRRLDITEAVHAAEYQFQVFHGNSYWLIFDSRIQKNILSMNGPSDWSTGKPNHYEYICKVKWLGDYTWIEDDTV